MWLEGFIGSSLRVASDGQRHKDRKGDRIVKRPKLLCVDSHSTHIGIDRIDVVLLSHFHDDHVIGVPMLQRLYATQCWAAESFADLVEDPAAHGFPCTSPVPIKVDRRIGFGGKSMSFTWPR